MKWLGDMAVRPARSEDVAAIQHVGLATWPPTYEPLAGPQYVIAGLARWWSRDAVVRSLETCDTWVAVADGDVVGMCCVGLLGDQRWLWKLYVIPERHGLGVGRRLMSAVLDRHGAADLYLSHAEGNERAAAFYATHGFVRVARRPSDGHLEIVMRRLAG